MFYKYTYPNHDNHYFSCGKYRQHLCPTTHHIRVDVIESLVLQIIDNAVRFARDFEDEFVGIVVSDQYKQIQLSQQRNRKRLASMCKREQDLDILFGRVYEDNALGRLSDEQFTMMVSGYEGENADLTAKCNLIEKELADTASQKANADKFVKLVERYADIRELSYEVLHEFIDRIEIHELDKDTNVRTIVIYYSFIGMVDCGQPPATNESHFRQIGATVTTRVSLPNAV